jgi:hypothetical protein
MLGFAYSLFWSASTIIYFLLRKAVDETDLDEVYMEEEQDELFPRPVSPPDVSTPAPPPPDVRVSTSAPSSQQPPASETPTPPSEPPTATS